MQQDLVPNGDVLANDALVLQPAPAAQLAAPPHDAVRHPRIVLHLRRWGATMRRTSDPAPQAALCSWRLADASVGSRAHMLLHQAGAYRPAAGRVHASRYLVWKILKFCL